MAILDCTQPEGWADWIDSDRPEDREPARVARALRQRFRALRAFHAARPVDVASYARLGIRPLTRSEWSALVDEVFLARASDPGLAAAIARARDVQFEFIDEGRVHFCCDERLLEERDGYHLLYGSLSLLALAIRIDKAFGTSFKAVLRERGEPVVFVCDLPTDLIENRELVRLAAALRDVRTQMRLTGDPARPFGFHFSIPCSLPAEAIVARRRPLRVVDRVYGHHIGAPPPSPPMRLELTPPHAH